MSFVDRTYNCVGSVVPQFNFIKPLDLVSLKVDLGKQYRSRSDATEAKSDRGLHCLPVNYNVKL